MAAALTAMASLPVSAKASSHGFKVSVCVITYNHETFIRQCLQSLVDQRTSFGFEIVVGEDGSTDGTRGIVQEFAAAHPELVRPLLRERNIGAMANFLDVHRAARGEYVCHCDGDDLWEPDKLEQQVRFMDAHPECSAVFTNSHVISEHGECVGVFSSGVPESFDIAYLIRDGNFLHHSSMMYRREWQDRIFPPAAEFIDFHVYILLARLGRLGYIDRRLTSYRASSPASVIRSDNGRIRRCGWEALREVTPAEAPRHSIRRADATFLADAAYQSLRSGRPGRYLAWLALVRQRGDASLLVTQWSALGILAASISRKLVFHVRVRLGLASAASRVFYPK
jgi:glycosyltransferase involved in cell wall biosynthesis